MLSVSCLHNVNSMDGRRKFKVAIHVDSTCARVSCYVFIMYEPFCIFQLDSYMDEQFIRAAFASAGHAVVNVKIIINKITG